MASVRSRRVKESQEILAAFGLPAEQRNERAALTLPSASRPFALKSLAYSYESALGRYAHNGFCREELSQEVGAEYPRNGKTIHVAPIRTGGIGNRQSR